MGDKSPKNKQKQAAKKADNKAKKAGTGAAKK